MSMNAGARHADNNDCKDGLYFCLLTLLGLTDVCTFSYFVGADSKSLVCIVF